MIMERLNNKINDFLYKYESQLTLIFHITGYILFIVGLIMLIGGIGNIDFAVETGTKLEPTEEIKNYIISIAGIVVTALSVKLISIGK